jgi:hypothetical protein
MADDLNTPWGKVSAKNSTSTPLIGDAVYTGTWEEVYTYSQMTLSVYTDVNSATNGLSMQFSSDGKNIDRQKNVTITANGGAHTLVHIARYFRIVYTNGSSPQPEFRLQVLHHRYKSKEITSSLTQSISDAIDVQNTRSVIVAKNSAGTYQNVNSDQFGDLIVDIGINNQTAFGELKTAHPTPIFQNLFSYNINSRIWITETANSGTISQANAMAIVSTGTTTASTALLESKRKIKYRAGQGVIARFTGIFTTPVAGTKQLLGIGDDENGFFFGYNGLDFGVLRRSKASGAIVDTWTTQVNWDEDNADGKKTLPVLDQTKGNVYQIQFQYLGFGSIRFFIEDPHPGNLILVHSIDYANTYTEPSLSIPSLPFCTYVENGGTTSNIIIKSASCGLFIEGNERIRGISNSTANSKSGIGSTETNILTIQNRETFNSINNADLVYPILLNVATITGTKPTTIKVIYNCTLGGTPSYTNINLNDSIVSYDTAGTTITNGDIIFTEILGKEESATVNLKDLDIFLNPTDILTVSATTPSGSVEVFVSLTWIEDL